MADTGIETRRFLTRKEAAAYITRKWFICSAASLAKYAVKKTGPRYGNKGGTGEAQYTQGDLDDWADAFVKPAAKDAR